MTSTSYIAAKLVADIAVFTPVVGPPNDDDLRNVRIVLLKVCLSISLAGSTPVKVTGLILIDAVYITTLGSNDTSFNEEEDSLAECDFTITAETAPWEQKKKEAIWTSKLENQACIADTKHGCRQFLLHAFDETYYITLCDENTFYEIVTPLQILTHIADAIGGLEVTGGGPEKGCK